MGPDSYLTLGAIGEGRYSSKGSKFLAYAYRIDEEAALGAHLQALRELHHKARHWCYGYRIGLGQDRWRANDDGEPAGSAGRPILGQIDSAGLTNVLVVVVRYFGGTKLGVPGLIEAYRTAAADALARAPKVVALVERQLLIRTDYGHYASVLQAVNCEPWRVVELLAEAEVEVRIACPASLFGAAHRELWRGLAGVYAGEERVEEEILGFWIGEV